VDEIVRRLLARPQEVLSRVRRLAQKPIIAQANLQYDLSAAYEHLDFVQHGLSGHFEPEWTPRLSAETELPREAIGRPIESYSE